LRRNLLGVNARAVAAAVAVAAWWFAAASARASGPPITLAVDATEAPRRVLHAKLRIPTAPGALTLLYPKWIPGEHGPTGPIQNVAGITISAGGRPLEWSRDGVELYAIRCEVPPGAAAVDLSLDYMITAGTEGLRGGSSVSSSLAVLDWNQVLFYPKGAPAESLTVEATLRVPEGWKWGTALPAERSAGNEIVFKAAPLVTLVDSPVLTGAYFRVIRLAPEITPKHEIDIAADSPEALEMKPARVASYERLVREEIACFGATHYRQYHFLWALSDQMTFSGLEHHESSDNRSPERSLIDDDLQIRTAQLLPHEFAHSWNGKYRRPGDMTRGAYLEPMETDLLWVYEGLTDYLAWVFATRSGLLTLDQSLADLAQTAATIANEPGRSWRSLHDTAVSAPMTGRSGRSWSGWRRSFGDVYSEGQLLWLEVDSILRRQSGGARSMDDFLRVFHGGRSGGPAVKTYTLADIVAALQTIAPYDWNGFFDARVRRISKASPLGGIEGNGWRLTYSDTLSPYVRAIERARQWTYLTFSWGLLLGTDGVILDVNPNLPAGKAGLAPGMKLVAVNGRTWTPERGRKAIAAARTSGKPIEVVAESGGSLKTFSIDYHGGERYPQLVREPAKPDYLTKLLSSRAGAPR
jgi:predicted metalloprotease with PDZ domain